MVSRTAVSNLGSHVYGLGAVALGLVGLVWGDFATVWQPIQALPFAVPHRESLAYFAAACLLSAGVAIQWRRSAPAGLSVLALLYFVFALFWLPRVIGYPQLFGTWGGMLEEMALAVAALVVYSSLLPRDSAGARRAALTGRLSFGVCVLAFGLSHFFAIPETAAMVPEWVPPNQKFWAVATGVFHLLAGVAILSGVLDVLGSRLLTLMLALFGALVWAPALFAQPREHMVWAGNAINLALTGAAWVVADSIADHRRPHAQEGRAT
ncbi:MAG: DoxX family membrane protein [Acidobacteria bacterium]|nr:DoxX family membrane protein [Acidobacteriota bacterium]